MSLRQSLEKSKTVWVAGVYDALSAVIAREAGFDTVMTGGFGVTASLLGMPDMELLTLTENVGIVSRVARLSGLSVIADIDTGYGNTANVLRAVTDFRQAGAAAVIIEDQVSPKSCPAYTDETAVIPVEEACAKIRAARHAAGEDVIVIARTDAVEPADAIVRAQAYAAAGAELIQPINKTFNDFEGLKELRNACGVPLSVQILGWMEKGLTSAQIEDIAGIATFSFASLLTTSHALMTNMRALVRDRDISNLPAPTISLAEFKELIGFDRMKNDQQQFYDVVGQ